MQTTKQSAFKRGRAEDWTRERVERLDREELQQLRDNAERLGEAELSSLCSAVLKALPKSRAGGAARDPFAGKRLLSRAKAFEMRGVRLQDPRTSWGGVRHTDGVIVLALWASAIESRSGGCRYLLWAPNQDGSRPWSDRPAGEERRQQCELAIERGSAEGLFAYGERLDGHEPEDKARSVHGIDPEASVRFKVEKRGAEYWAVWGRKAD